MRVDSYFRVRVLGAVAAAALCACSSGPLPPAPSTALVPATSVPGAVARMIVSPNAMCNKKQFELCVTQGTENSFTIALKCMTHTGVAISCGTIHWKVKTSNKGLKASFDPKVESAPNDSTKDTVKASKTIPPGVYSQTITATCTAVKKPKTGTFPVTVLKKK
jgi:hypothetical protein